jgi:hypothetical protein
MYYMVGVTFSGVSLRNLIARNPDRAKSKFIELLDKLKNKVGSSFLTAFRSSLGANDKKMYFDYLHTELIPRVFPRQLNEFAKEEDLEDCWDAADSWNSYLDLVNRKILDRAQIIMEKLSQFTQLDFKYDNGEHVNQFIDLMENIQVFSGFNTALKVLFKLLKLIPNKLKESSSSILKNNVIATLNSNVTKGTIWKMMKKDLGEFLGLDWRITDSSSKTYNKEDFLLSDDGLVFNPSKIDINGTRAQGESASMETYIVRDARNNESRVGCPASFNDLEMLINHMEKIVQLVPDDKFSQWMQAV